MCLSQVRSLYQIFFSFFGLQINQAVGFLVQIVWYFVMSGTIIDCYWYEVLSRLLQKSQNTRQRHYYAEAAAGTICIKLYISEGGRLGCFVCRYLMVRCFRLSYVHCLWAHFYGSATAWKKKFSFIMSNRINIIGIWVPFKVYMSVRQGPTDLELISWISDQGWSYVNRSV